MYTLHQAAAQLGLSEDQLRRRLRTVLRGLDGQAGAWVARGPHGQLLLAPEIVDLIGAIESQARQTGLSFGAAVEAFAQGGTKVAEPKGESQGSPKVAPRHENPDQALARAVFWGLCAIAIAIFLGLTLVSLRL